MAKPATRTHERGEDRTPARDERARVGVHLDHDLHHRLRRAAAERGESESDIMRGALENELTKHEARRRR